MPKASPIPDAVWESHKEIIRDIYLREELKDLVRIMEESYNFRATDKQYIRRLGRWKFKKYSTTEQWQHTGQLLSKRQLEGKKSEIRINGRPVPKEKLKKELARYCAKPMQPMQPYHLTVNSMSPGSVEVCTPPSMVAEEANHMRIRIPWFDFEKSLEETVAQVNPSGFYSASTVPSDAGQMIDLEDGLPTTLSYSEAHIDAAASNLSSEVSSSVQDLNYHVTVGGESVTPGANPFTREACCLLAQLFGKNIGPDSTEYIPEISSALNNILIEKIQGETEMNMARLFNGSPREVSSQLLRYSIYLASNGPMSDTAMDSFFRWMTRYRQFGVVKPLITMRTPTTDTFASYLLVSAARLQDLDTVRDLIALGVDVNIPVGRWSRRTALFQAVRHKNYRLATILIHAEADPNIHDHWYSSPLQKAIEYEEKDLVLMLLRSPVDTRLPRCKVTSGNLYFAIAGNNPDLVRILLAGNVSWCDNHSITSLLQDAAERNYTEIVRILLIAGADANVQEDVKTGGNRRPIQFAARNDNTEMVQMLLDFEAEVEWPMPTKYVVQLDEHTTEIDCKDSDLCYRYRTAIQYAAKNKNLTMAKILLEAGAKINNVTYGWTPLQIAASNNDTDLTNLLLGYGADVNVPAWKCHGRTAFQSAVENGHHALINILIKAGADINAPAGDHCGRTAIQAAVKSRDAALVDKLIQLGADVNAAPSSIGGRTCLQLAAENGDTEIVQKLLQSGAQVNFRIASDYDSGQTPLQEALQRRHMAVVCLLLEGGADTSPPTPFLLASIASLELKMVELVFKEVSCSRDDISPCVPAAAKSGWPEILRYVLEAGADVNYQDPFGVAAIHEAVENEDISMARILIDCGAEINLVGEKKFELMDYETSKMRPLAIAAGLGNLELVQLLLSAGASVDNATDDDNTEVTALCASMLDSSSCDTKDIITTLVKAGADLNREVVGLGMPLELAMKMVGMHLVPFFLEWGANVNKLSTKRTTALQMAAQCDCVNTMEALLRAGAGATINTPAGGQYGDKTALQYAAWCGNQAAVTLLLQHGADCNAAAGNFAGVTALQAAAMNGNLPITVLLLEAGAEINAPPAEISGRTALEGAAEQGHLQIVLLLLENDTDKDNLERRCKNAAKFAEEAHYPIIAKFLRDYRVV